MFALVLRNGTIKIELFLFSFSSGSLNIVAGGNGVIKVNK